MKLGLVFSAMPLVFAAASFNAIARADATDGPAASVATFTTGKSTAPVQLPATVSRVQVCRVSKAGDLDCSAPVALQGKADRSAK